jgi:ribonuclease HI
MLIEGFFAGICEPISPGGFCAYGALIRVNGVLTWADAAAVGSGARCNVNIARYTGAVVLLRKLRALHEQRPEHTMTMVTDSRKTIEELSGEWKLSRCDYSALLDQAADLVQALDGVLTLRWIPRRDNLTAHELAKAYLRRHGIEFDDRDIYGEGDRA